MKRFLHPKSIGLLAVVAFAQTVFAQSDDCSSAPLIATVPFGSSCSASVAGTTAGATQSLPNPLCTSTENNDDVWYKFVAASQSVVIRWGSVTNNGTGGSAFAGYALYNGCGGAQLFCNVLGSAGVGFRIHDGLTIGNTYFIRVWSTLTGTNSISFSFCVQDVPPAPVNNDCSGALPVAVQSVGTVCSAGITANTAGATASAPLPPCSPTFANDDVWYSFVAPAGGVRFNFSNAIQLLVPSANANLGYVLYKGSCAAGTPSLLCTGFSPPGSGSVLFGGLQRDSTYFLRVYSSVENNYASFDFCLVAVDLPPNDECSNAVNLPVSNGFCTAPVLTTLANATTSPGFGAPVCATLSGSEDVWYKLTVPPSGRVVVQTSTADPSILDLIMEAYAGGCGALALLACDDNGNPETQSESHARLSLSGRTPGEVIFIRVLSKGTINFGPFVVCAWDSTVRLPVSPGGACIATNPVTINAAAGNRFLWVPLLDAGGNIVAEINARGKELGVVNAEVFRNSGAVRNTNGQFYLDRNIAITPTINTSAAVRAYFTAAELAALQSVDATVTGRASLRIAKAETACATPLGGGPLFRTQDSNAAYGADHFVQFTTPSFSNFFLQGPGAVLPVVLAGYSASCTNGRAEIRWRTTTEVEHRSFTVERSTDALRFEPVAVFYATAAAGEKEYRFVDSLLFSGKRYYRLKQTDVNGAVKYYGLLPVSCEGESTMRFYPNPVSEGGWLTLPSGFAGSRIRLMQTGGQCVKGWRVAGTGSFFVDTKALPRGFYFIEAMNGNTGRQVRLKLVKE